MPTTDDSSTNNDNDLPAYIPDSLEAWRNQFPGDSRIFYGRNADGGPSAEAIKQLYLSLMPSMSQEQLLDDLTAIITATDAEAVQSHLLRQSETPRG